MTADQATESWDDYELRRLTITVQRQMQDALLDILSRDQSVDVESLTRATMDCVADLFPPTEYEVEVVGDEVFVREKKPIWTITIDVPTEDK